MCLDSNLYVASSHQDDHIIPVSSITYLHQEYLCSICNESGLQGLEYVGGSELNCRTGCSAKVLRVVSYPSTGSINEELATCEECGTEYKTADIFKTQVILPTHTCQYLIFMKCYCISFSANPL